VIADTLLMDTRPLNPIPQAVLFDLDDTLCDYASARASRLRIAFSLDAEGRFINRPDEMLAELMAESIRIHPHGVDHFKALLARFGIADARVAEAAAHWYRENPYDGLRLYPGADQVLIAVQSTKSGGQRRPVGIITNGPADVQRAKLKLLGLERLVDFVVISEEFGAAKPSGEIFDEALRLAGVTAGDAVFIGDSAAYDMVGALDRGIPSVWVNSRAAHWDRLDRRPNREVRSVIEVPALVGST
jgi:HAD superfamily hydrolase (TIGR01549 family)